MHQPRIDNFLELGDELMHALRGEVEPEHFDGNEALALGIVGTKHRTQRPSADLMKNPERTEPV